MHIPVAPLVQLPAAVISVKFTTSPAHTLFVPVIPAGSGFTVMVVVVMQPVPNVYVTAAVPLTIPVTTPLLVPILPVAAAPDVHVPPVVASLSVVFNPTHTVCVPLIVAGNGFTVTLDIAIQPVFSL